jgi:hypothetical protein
MRLPLNNRLDLGINPAPTRLRIPRSWAILIKHKLNLLQRLTTRLRVREERLNRGTESQYAEDDEDFVGDIAKGWWDEEPKGPVEEPVADGGEGHTGGAGFEGPDFGRVDPGYGGEGQSVNDNEDVAEGYDCVGWGSFDLNDNVCIWRCPDSARDNNSIFSHQATDDKLTYSHSDSTVDEEGTTASLVDEHN